MWKTAREIGKRWPKATEGQVPPFPLGSMFVGGVAACLFFINTKHSGPFIHSAPGSGSQQASLSGGLAPPKLKLLEGPPF